MLLSLHHNPSKVLKLLLYTQRLCVCVCVFDECTTNTGRAGYVKRVVTTEVSARRLILRGDEVMSESAANMTKERRICSTDLMEAEVVMDQPNATRKEPPFSLHMPATRCSVRNQNTPRPIRMAS